MRARWIALAVGALVLTACAAPTATSTGTPTGWTSAWLSPEATGMPTAGGQPGTVGSAAPSSGDPSSAVSSLAAPSSTAPAPDVPASVVPGSVVPGSDVPASETPAPDATTPSDITTGPHQTAEFHGVTVQVPKAWKQNDTRCGTPVSNTWVLPGPVPACLIEPAPKVTSVQFGSVADVAVTVPPDWITTSITVPAGAAKVPATRSQTPAGTVPFQVRVTVPSRFASVLFVAQRADTVQALAATLAVSDTDTNGCAVLGKNVNQLTSGGPATREGSDAAMIPGAPSRLRVCRYATGLLEQSVSLDGSGLAKLVTAVNAAPAGWSVAPTGSYVPEICRPADTPVGQATVESISDAESYLIRAEYDQGPAVDILVRLGYCGKLGESNGTRTAQRTAAVADLLVEQVGNSSGWPTTVLPGK